MPLTLEWHEEFKIVLRNLFAVFYKKEQSYLKATFYKRKNLKIDGKEELRQLQCQRKLLSFRFIQTIPFLVDLKVTRLDRCPYFQQKARDFLAFQPKNKFNELCLTKRTMKRVANGFSMRKIIFEEKVSLLWNFIVEFIEKQRVRTNLFGIKL